MFSGIKERLIPYFVGGVMGAVLGAAAGAFLEELFKTPDGILPFVGAIIGGLIMANGIERRYNQNRTSLTR